MTIQKIVAPSGASTTISVLPGRMLQFDFNTSSATVDRIGNDLTLNFNDGGTTVIHDFFVTAGADLPVFILSDGSEISSSDLLQNMNPNLDLTTAAGPTAHVTGSGAGNYGDGAGDLLSGVDRLSSLNSDFWVQEAMTPEFSVGENLSGSSTANGYDGGYGGGMASGDASGDTGGNTGEDIGGATDGNESLPPLPPVALNPTGYEARAILYTKDGADENAYGAEQVNFRLLNDGEVQHLYSKHGLIDITSLIENPDGSYSLKLQGLAVEDALALSGGDNIFDYITFGLADGTQYTMQVVINTTGSYTPADAHDPDMTNNMAHTQGEWHTQNKVDGSGNWEGTGNDDDFWLGNIGGGVTINDTTSASSGIIISHGTGHDTLHTKDVMAIESGGDNSITFLNNDIHAHGNIRAYTGLKNSIEANKITVDGDVRAFRAGQNIVDGKQGVSIVTESSSYTVEPVTAMVDGAMNRIDSLLGSVDIVTTGNHPSFSYVRSVSAYQSGRNILTAGQDVNVTTVSKNSMTAGLFAGENSNSGGHNSVSAGSAVNIFVDSKNGSATGMEANLGTNTVRAGSTATVSVGYSPDDGMATSGSATGLQAQHGGRNTFEAQSDALIRAASLDQGATGLKALKVYGFRSGGVNEVISKTGSVEIAAESGTGNAYALYSSAATNRVTANSGEITGQAISDSHNAYGMYATNYNTSGATNMLQADSVILEAQSLHKDAYGMYAETTSTGKSVKHTNTILVKSEASVTVQSGEGDAYAMYTMAGTNKIAAAEGSSGITVTIMGTGVSESYAMYAASSLDSRSSINTNEIIGSGGHDRIVIDGAIAAEVGGENKIFTNAGNDVVHLKNTVGENGLTLNMGEGDYDTLVLYASSKNEFMSKYGEWLQQTNFAEGNIEAVHITFEEGSGVLPDDEYSFLYDYLKTKFPGADFSYSHESETEGTILNVGELDIIHLGSILDIRDYSDVFINLTDGKDNQLTIDGDFFNEHTVQGSLKIAGDATDSVILEGNWQQSGDSVTTIDGIGYTTYTNTDTDQSIFIQMEILNITS